MSARISFYELADMAVRAPSRAISAMLPLVVLITHTAMAALSVDNLRCEYEVNPLGVDSPHPRLFWAVQSKTRGDQQRAYQVLVASSQKLLANNTGDLWDSGTVDSDETIQIPYTGKDLTSSQQVFWKVRAWDQNQNVSPWSKPATWTMGILRGGDWQARWITALDTNAATLLLRHEFTVKHGLRRALVNICGLGEYELSLNGTRTGDDFFPSGWTKFDKTCLYDTRDITPLLRAGKNAAGILLGPGMYRVVGPTNRFAKFRGTFGSLKAIAEIRLEYEDGSLEFVGTGGDWRASAGPITFCSVYGGEDFDARLMQPGWNKVGFDDSKWPAAQLTAGPGGRLAGLSCSAPPIQGFETHRPVSVQTLGNGDSVFDLDQNASHMIRFTATGPAGTAIRIFPAELTNADGSISQGSMGGGRRGQVYCDFIKATDGAEEFAPKFFYVGCRYVQAHMTPPKAGGARARIKSLDALVVHSASEPAGEFECSNPLFNRIRTLVRWAQRSNMMSVMTDCPHRERLGWLEQDNLNGPALRYEFDVAQLFTKTMNDIADSQLPNGLVPTTAPEYAIFRDKSDTNHLRNNFGDSPEWSSTCILAPWQQYEFDGDVDLLRRHYNTMKRYLEYLGSRATNGIVSHGLGDWYDIGPRAPGVSQLTPVALSATAFYFYDARIMSRIAAVLGAQEDAQRFDQLSRQNCSAFNEQFYDAMNHVYATGSQTANSIPLVMGLVEPADRPAVLDAVVRDVRSRGNTLTAGDVGYGYLLRALADGGRSDVIFAMNNQSERPGYGYQLKRGATSLTEAWDARPGSSQDHFMLGQITEWFYRDLAGIRSDPDGPGFKKIIIAPQPVGDLTWVNASYNSIRGRIVSDWKRDGDRFTLKIAIPANTTATIFVPANSASSVTENGRATKDAKSVRFLREESGSTVYAVESGDYLFESRLPVSH